MRNIHKSINIVEYPLQAYTHAVISVTIYERNCRFLAMENWHILTDCVAAKILL